MISEIMIYFIAKSPCHSTAKVENKKITLNYSTQHANYDDPS